MLGVLRANKRGLPWSLDDGWPWKSWAGQVSARLTRREPPKPSSEPLKQISAALRRLADGDFRTEPVRLPSHDELGELAHAYNRAMHQVQAALAQRDRSEAKVRQFIADAGHELRTPLTVIMGYLDTLEDGMCEAPGLRRRVVAAMRQESRRMRALIEKLICLARLERGEATVREVVDVSEVVSRVIESSPNPAATIAVSATSEARVVADESDIFDAIRNLVENALKYAPGSDVAVSTAVQGDDVVVVVRDRGPGMSEHDQAHAFDRFYRGHAVDGVDGSGIGLAIVKAAAERSGGTVSVESRTGDGAAFTIRLPHSPQA